jgi:hypothetical protein
MNVDCELVCDCDCACGLLSEGVNERAGWPDGLNSTIQLSTSTQKKMKKKQ